MVGFDGLSRGQPHSRAERRPSHFPKWLPHSGQRRRGHPGELGVVEPDDADVLWDAQTPDPGRFYDAESHFIAAGKMAVGGSGWSSTKAPMATPVS